MSDGTKDKSDKLAAGETSESALQEELRRETEEGRDSIGDVAENRNLSGSSTWETLKDEPEKR